ncbi:MAG: DUF4115 domain-containing protein [Sideroxydans sp.]|nr:DUF4115 domain-containing protein [Sideroxydans sp.]
MENIPEAQKLSEAVIGVGARLRAARESQGLTASDIASRIKFSVKQVESLEIGDQAHLPEGAFLRGFIRSYARTVQLDEADLIGELQSSVAEKNSLHEDPLPIMSVESNSTNSRNNGYWRWVGVVALLVLAGWVWQQLSQPVFEKSVISEIKLPEPIPVSSSVAATSGVEMTDSLRSEIPVMQPTSSVITPALPKSIDVKDAQVKPENKDSTSGMDSLKQATEKVASAVSTTDLAVLEQLKKRPLHFVFTADSWAEVVDKNGETLLSKMNPAGSEKWIGGRVRAPYKISIGNVSGVRLYNRGREIDLSQYKQSGKAQLVVE